MIEVSGLKKIYRLGNVEVEALKGISISIQRGEFVGIMGPSGSGKSTLLHQMALLDMPSAGTILINTTDVSHLSDEERTNFRLMNLGYVFQDYALVSELNVQENVALPAIMQGRSLADSYAAAASVLEKVGPCRPAQSPCIRAFRWRAATGLDRASSGQQTVNCLCR